MRTEAQLSAYMGFVQNKIAFLCAYFSGCETVHDLGVGEYGRHIRVLQQDGAVYIRRTESSIEAYDVALDGQGTSEKHYGRIGDIDAYIPGCAASGEGIEGIADYAFLELIVAAAVLAEARVVVPYGSDGGNHLARCKKVGIEG